MKRLALALLAGLIVGVAVAAPAKKAVRKPAARPAPAAKAGPVQTAHRRSPYVGAISADAATGEVLFADNADAEAYPASVTKLMTALLVLEDVAAGRYTLATRVTATPEVYASEASWVGLKAGQTMTVEDLLTALLVNSANDAAIALAVQASGSHQAFVARMNARAARLGMTRTRYFNANGLPPNPARRYPWKDFNRTTAADQLKLAREILKRHPGILKYTSIKVRSAAETPVRDGAGRPYPLKNHNHVMMWDRRKIINPDGTEAVDGLKTGYINAGGSSVVLTGSRKGRRAIVVVLGSSSSDERDAHGARLMADALGALAW